MESATIVDLVHTWTPGTQIIKLKILDVTFTITGNKNVIIDANNITS